MKNCCLLLKLFFCAWLLAATGAHRLCAQSYSEKDFVHYTTKNGLSDNEVTCMQQDEHGYIWIGTQVGLNRFDGHSFQNFFAADKTLHLLHDKVNKLKKFGPHKLGIIGDGGMLIVNTSDFSQAACHFPDTGPAGFAKNKCWDAAPLAGGRYAVSSMWGFYVVDEKNNPVYQYDAYKEEDIGRRRIFYGRNIFTLPGNDLLLYHDEKNLSYYSSRSNKLIAVDSADKQWGMFAHPRSSPDDKWSAYAQLSATGFVFFRPLKDSIVYYDLSRKKRTASALPFHCAQRIGWNSKVCALNDSVFLVNGKDKGFYMFYLNRQTGRISFDQRKFLTSVHINTLFSDKDKRLWVGGADGVYCQKQTINPVYTYTLPPLRTDVESYGYNAVFRHKDKIYLGRYSQTLGLVIANATTMRIEKELQFFEKGKWNEVWSIQMYHPDTLWLGTNGGIIWFDTKTSHYGKVMDPATHSPVYNTCILAPPRADGYAWMTSYLGGRAGRYNISSRSFTWFTENTRPALPFSKVKSIVYDAYGDVWIGGHSLARWNTRQNRFDTLIKAYGGAGRYSDDIVALSADDKGSLWLHNAYNGLLQYRIREKKFISYTTADGLPTNVIKSLGPVTGNILWIADNNRLIRFNTVTKKAEVYTQDDGVSEHQPMGGNIYFDSTGKKFYYPCENDIVSFSQDAATQTYHSSDLLLQGLSINPEKNIPEPKDSLRLGPGDDNIVLHFTVVDFEAANGYRFSYRLSDEKDWHDLGEQRSLALSKLDPGDYEIFIKAISKGNEKIRSFRFFIAAPFWERWWFFVLLSLLLATGIISLYRYRIAQVRQKANMEKQIAELEMKGLHAQMNPHFIFNSLNSIKEMILGDEKANASRYLSRFAQLIRTSLDQSGQTFITVRQCVDHLAQYLEMEKLRFGNFEYTISIDKRPGTEELAIAPMLVQPLAENAIWHGLHPNTGEKKLQVRFYVSGQNLICEVEDNGIGIQKSKQNKAGRLATHRSLGIENINERLNVLSEKYRMTCLLTITDKSLVQGCNESGTIARLQINIF